MRASSRSSACGGLGEPERGGAGDQGAEDGVEGVVGLDAGLARARRPLQPGRRGLERGEQLLAGLGSDSSRRGAGPRAAAPPPGRP